MLQSVHALKSRLEWGQPGLTIVDVRDRSSFNHGHIMGAVPMPLDSLSERAKTVLHLSRDIYIYGETDEQSINAVEMLRQAGFVHVSEIEGGLSAWQSIGGATEGI